MTILNPSKTDGGIMTCYKEDDDLVVDQDTIQLECLKRLEELQMIPDQVAGEQIEFPDLEPLNNEEIKWIQDLLSHNKGITQDMWSDTFLKKMDKPELLSNLWRGDVMKRLKGSFKARLVPLNKNWHEIPDKTQFRPIILLPSMYKFLELRFLPKLQKYMSKEMDKN